MGTKMTPIVLVKKEDVVNALTKQINDALRLVPELYLRPQDVVERMPSSEMVSAKDFRDCRNELCLKCGQYRTKHLGSCNGCRWESE